MIFLRVESATSLWRRRDSAGFQPLLGAASRGYRANPGRGRSISPSTDWTSFRARMIPGTKRSVTASTFRLDSISVRLANGIPGSTWRCSYRAVRYGGIHRRKNGVRRRGIFHELRNQRNIPVRRGNTRSIRISQCPWMVKKMLVICQYRPVRWASYRVYSRRRTFLRYRCSESGGYRYHRTPNKMLALADDLAVGMLSL
jgi:hypothetical protein